MKRLPNGFNFHLISKEIYFAIFTENAINIFPVGNQAKDISYRVYRNVKPLYLSVFIVIINR